MRITGGAWRGRQFQPNGFIGRPTTDFGREGLFNLLSTRLDLEGADVLDLFAGSGPSGIVSLQERRNCILVDASKDMPKQFEMLRKKVELPKGDEIIKNPKPEKLSKFFETSPALKHEVKLHCRTKKGKGKEKKEGGSTGLMLAEKGEKKIKSLVITPTRELAMQTSLVIKNLSKHIKIECMVSTGGTLVREDFYRLSQTVHVIVATPGRILDLASKKVANLECCDLLILDEVDKLLSMDFNVNIEDIETVISHPQVTEAA